MADVVYFDGGIDLPFCPPTVNGIYISGSGCCSEFYSAFIGGNQTYNLTYTLPTASGTNGQVLTNDGNGNLSWTTVSGGGGGTGTITGTGTTNYLSKWSSSTALTNSIILETGSTIDISGALRVTASSGTATSVMGRDANGYVSNLSLGNGLSISGGTLSFTGSTGVSGNFVPYLGATGNTDLGGYGIAGSYFQLSTSTGGTLVPGMFSWNGSDGTADLMLKGGTVTLPIGETQLARVINETGANLLKSQYRVVRVNGSTGTRLKVALALASGDATSVETLGIVAENITLSQEGFVITSGLIKGINTTGSLQSETWLDGDMLFLSPFVAGGLTNIKPQAPNHLVVMGYVVTAANNGVIYVKVDNGYELDELHNVLISSAATNNILAYDGVANLWRNRTASSLNLVSGSGVTGIVPRWASSSGLTDSIIFSTGTVVGINTTSPAQTLDIRGTMRLTGSTGTGTTLMGRDGSGDVSAISVGSGLSLSGNTITATGSSGGGLSGSGTATQVAFWNGTVGSTSTTLTSSTGLTWDNANTRLGIGFSSPAQALEVNGSALIRAGAVSGTFIGGGSTTRYTTNSGVNTSAIYLSAPSLGNDMFVVFVGGNANSNIYQYWNSNGDIRTRGSGYFGAASGAEVLGTLPARFTIKASGNTSGNAFLVQNSTPTNLLTVVENGDISFGTALNWNATNTRLGIGTASPSARLHVVGSGITTGTTFLTQSSGGTNTFSVLDNGNVGINNASPAARLYVKGETNGNASTVFEVTDNTDRDIINVRDDGRIRLGRDLSVLTQSSVTIQAAGTETNIGIAIVPKGTGAITALIPDGGAGGVARGQYAVDLQLQTNENLKVAKGNYSTIIGGSSNRTEGTYSTCIGGSGHIVYGEYSVAAGQGSQVAGGHSLGVGFGVQCNAISTYSLGYLTIANAAYSFASGQYSRTDLQGQNTFASNRFSGTGDAQTSNIRLQRIVSGTTATELTLNGSAPTGTTRAILPIPTGAVNGRLWNAIVQLSAICTTAGGTVTVGESFIGTYNLGIKRILNATSLVGTVQNMITAQADANMSSSVVTITADDANESLKIEFTPPTGANASTVIRVVATVYLTEVGY